MTRLIKREWFLYPKDTYGNRQVKAGRPIHIFTFNKGSEEELKKVRNWCFDAGIAKSFMFAHGITSYHIEFLYTFGRLPNNFYGQNALFKAIWLFKGSKKHPTEKFEKHLYLKTGQYKILEVYKDLMEKKIIVKDGFHKFNREFFPDNDCIDQFLRSAYHELRNTEPPEMLLTIIEQVGNNSKMSHET